VTGMSATGKSSVLVELAHRGHRVVDTDDDGWSEEVTGPDGTEQLWREDRMRELLAEDVPGTLFVAGCVSNQGRFYDRFDAIVLLSVPVDVLLGRLTSRDTNDFGKNPEERQRILRDLATVEPLLQATSTAEVDATRPLREVADDVEAFARRPD
jgi:dephospho-CoA kinase